MKREQKALLFPTASSVGQCKRHTFQHGFDGNGLFGYLDIHLEDFPIGAL